MGLASSLREIEQRPSRGTTVSVYGFREVPPLKKWDVSTICSLVAAVAVAKLEVRFSSIVAIINPDNSRNALFTPVQVSFSIRDEDRKRVVLRIARPHSPIGVLGTLLGKDLPSSRVWSIQCGPEFGARYHGYVGLSDKGAMQWIFLNHRPICCPLILRLIKIAFEERLNLSSDRESRDRNMFILFFLTFSRKEFTFVTETGRSYITFYDMQKILNAIKTCAFKRLAENATVSAPIPYSCKTQLLRIYLKSEKSVSSNVNGRKNVTSSLIENRVTIGFKGGETTSAIVTDHVDTQHRDNNTESIKCYMDKKNNVLNSTRCQITSMKHANLCEEKAVKKTHNGDDKVRGSSMNDVARNSIKSDKAYNNHDNNNFVDMITPLSEWSNWTYHTNNKTRDPTRNTNNVISENDIRSRLFYESNNQFDFLPRKLHGLLHRRHVKLTNVKCFDSPNDTVPCK